MKQSIPRSPFSTRLSTSAKETELRLRNIFQWKKKRPPIIAFIAAILVIALCGSLVGFRTTAPEEPPVDGTVVENTPSENEPNQEDTTDASAVQPETAHDWAGSGYLYYSAALGASIEFPPEWGSLLHVYDYENTVRIDTLVGWDDTAPDNGRMATIYKFTREDWDTQSGVYQKGMFEGGPTVQIIAENEDYVYILKRYGGLTGFKTLNDPGFNEYKTIDEALENYELDIHINDSSDFGLPDVIELSTSDGKTYPAQRYDGDGWYIYIPEGWYKENVWDQWNSQYDTGAYLNIQHCSDQMDDIKAYYGALGAWPYDTDMESPYDYYYLLTPSARDTIRQELFFVPVSETSSYALTCTWVKASQRDGEYDLLHAMAASFAVDERVQPATMEDPSVVLDLSQEPPLSESDLALAVPDFLTEEQQLLYRKARNLYEHAFGADTWFIEYPETMNGPFAEYETLERNDHIYTRSQGRYSDWTLFDTVIHSVFTDSFFQSKNTENLYVEHDGCLYFVNVARGCGYYYNDNFPDEFRLIEQTATSIKFAVIGHYSEAWPKDDETTEERNRRLEREYEYTWEFPISMVLTEDGWRFDEFYSPLTDEISSDAIA